MAHDSEARLAHFSPDGRFVLTGSHDDTARLWSARDGEPLSPPLHHNGDVKCAAFRPDGGAVATGSADGTVRLWEVPTGRSLLAPLFHESWIRPNAGMVRTVAFSPDGATLVTGCDDGTARLWNAADGTLLTVLQHRGAVNSIAFSPDGKIVLTGSSDRTARLWALPRPVDDDPSRVILWAQVLTGMERESDGTMQVLTLEEWQKRSSSLKKLGGFPEAPHSGR
jgi:WD40 repeat protein